MGKSNMLSGILVLAIILMIPIIIPGILLPSVYLGVSVLMVIIGILLFVAGYFYGSGKERHSSSRNEGHDSTETVTTTSSGPNRSVSTGRYERGNHVEETRTQTHDIGTETHGNSGTEGHKITETITMTSSTPTGIVYAGSNNKPGRHVEETRTRITSSSEGN